MPYNVLKLMRSGFRMNTATAGIRRFQTQALRKESDFNARAASHTMSLNLWNNKKNAGLEVKLMDFHLTVAYQKNPIDV